MSEHKHVFISEQGVDRCVGCAMTRDETEKQLRDEIHGIRLSPLENVARILLDDIRLAKSAQKNKGGQHCGTGGPLDRCLMSTLRYLEQTLLHGLGEEAP